MKFLLVNPFYPLAEMPSPPLGISYLAASLVRAGVEVRVYDMVVMGHDQKKLAAVMARFQPDIIGATSVTMTFNSAIAVIEAAKAIDPRVVTACGGAHVSFRAERTLREHSALDIVALGEGEDTIVELCDALAGKRSLHSVAGLCFRDGDDVVNTGPRPAFLDVNQLPIPARELGPLTRYRALSTPISMTTSRGCPFQCIFCVGRKLVGAKVRWRNAESVVDEMARLAAFGFSQINLADDLFTAKKSHALAVCDEIIRRKLKVTWVSFANVNTVDVPLLTRMREAGCTTVSFGLESGNAEILKTVRKGTRPSGMIAAAKACREAGILATGSFIVGLPGESAETLAETMALSDTLAELGAQCGFHMLAPFPGTAIREEADKYQIKIFSDDWSDYHANHAITETPTAPRAMQEVIAKRFEEAGQRAFWDLAEQVERGSASDQQRVQYAAIERSGIFEDLMLRDLLETRGSFLTAQAQVSREEATRLLVTEMLAATGRPPQAVHDAISFGLDHGVLEYSSAHGVCTFRFAGSDESLSITEAVRAPARLPITQGS
ncbi:MAG: radical SAM protein [Polyangiales bacterium]